MNKKEVREWLKAHRETKDRIDALRKELESIDLLSLLAMVEMNDVLLDRIKTLVVAEVLHSRGLADQTNLG